MIENLGEHTKVPKRFSLPYQGSCQAGRPFLTISYLVTLASSRLAMTTTLLLEAGILRILQELSVTTARSLPHHQITTTLLSQFIPLMLIPHLLKPTPPPNNYYPTEPVYTTNAYPP